MRQPVHHRSTGPGQIASVSILDFANFCNTAHLGCVTRELCTPGLSRAVDGALDQPPRPCQHRHPPQNAPYVRLQAAGSIDLSPSLVVGLSLSEGALCLLLVLGSGFWVI